MKMASLSNMRRKKRKKKSSKERKRNGEERNLQHKKLDADRGLNDQTLEISRAKARSRFRWRKAMKQCGSCGGYFDPESADAALHRMGVCAGGR